MIDLSRRNVFVHIPKTGGAFIERWLPRGFRLGWDERGALGSFSNPAHSLLARANQHCTLAQIEDLVFGGPVPDDFRIFTVVRHPERRFLGAWASRKLPPARLSPIRGRLRAGLLMRLAERRHRRLPDLALHLRPAGGPSGRDGLGGPGAGATARIRRRRLGRPAAGLGAGPDAAGAEKRLSAPRADARGEARGGPGRRGPVLCRGFWPVRL
ncbi:hypothetical protein [Paracoccus sphaerophysae]|uniref:hypothetical protein n=1 Tax=Paracoccus sphaerophysae TaxID=690417 RepID=UPI0012EC7AE1|nr:hypothetical protein [Paracoccus sphaerophysae]